ncbi:multidrug efflux SMR transporter [Myxococcus sp. MISCRS1]|uniref:DMT family transporter n=1 Tax=Myxococcus TaxID=32 RepID=UPI001CBC2DCD|nr:MULTISPECIES: multidrug efflux SMR transporter [unclassified Myxococcus]MBZ4401187.1 multidrug efflux SMR transporter [Myxococcus sp. AS-1-15]MBZ4410996.1 multidrug efflux SMR transporter [Myxococcus sp. XM-1-1-1]MCY0997054.1 multidrug efflux SMR transporter [Myxococcus sp. MISCRS1]BDT32925.1 multidrug efflux SMR transporter [Myxococcus sp. MH1]
MAWLLLVVAGALEIAWALALKQSEGLTRLWPSVVGIGIALTSLVLLGLALKHLPIGTAYAVWVGLGASGVSLVGMMFLGEPVSLARILCLVLIGVGVAGLRALEG